jgi:hypothetical protein
MEIILIIVLKVKEYGNQSLKEHITSNIKFDPGPHNPLCGLAYSRGTNLLMNIPCNHITKVNTFRDHTELSK